MVATGATGASLSGCFWEGTLGVDETANEVSPPRAMCAGTVTRSRTRLHRSPLINFPNRIADAVGSRGHDHGVEGEEHRERVASRAGVGGVGFLSHSCTPRTVMYSKISMLTAATNMIKSLIRKVVVTK